MPIIIPLFKTSNKKNLKNVCRKMMHYEQRKEDEDDIKFIGKKNAGQKTMEEHL